MRLSNAGHLGRLVLLLLAGIGVFLLIRQLAVPKGFGQYGHYRGPALAELSSRPVVFAGRAACETCHTDQVDVLNKGPHKALGCEACHGPQAAHASDLNAPKPKLPDAAVLCARCHEANSAKPKNFPQVNTKEHMPGVVCTTCHNPHQPKPEP